MANWYVSSVAWTAVTAWAAGATVSAASNGGRGDYRRQLAAPAAGSERVWRCTTGGTTGGSEPTWTLTAGSTTSDNGVVWTECTGAEADQVGGTLRAPHARLRNAIASGWANLATDTIYIADNSAATEAATVTWAFGTTASFLTPVISFNHSGFSIPPVAADYANGAQETTTAGSSLNLTGYAYLDGLTLNVGTTASGASVVFGGGSAIDGYLIIVNGAVKLLSTSTSNAVVVSMSTANHGYKAELINTPITFSNASQSIQLRGGSLIWRDTPSAIPGTVPSLLFKQQTTEVWGSALVKGVDLSAISSGSLVDGTIQNSQAIEFRNCTLGGATTVSNSNVPFSPQATVVNLDDCSSSGQNYYWERPRYEGLANADVSVARAGGASDGTNAWSAKIVTNSNPSVLKPFSLEKMCAAWQNVTGSPVTFGVAIISNGSALLNNDDIWAVLDVMTTGGTPLSTRVSNGKANVLAANAALPADTGSDWTAGTVAARQNSNAYTLGQVIKLATNSGRLFFCTTAGTTAGSEPGGYASATDGSTAVTDGSAAFRAGVRQILNVTATPALKGWAQATIRVAKASLTVYADLAPQGLSG